MVSSLHRFLAPAFLLVLSSGTATALAQPTPLSSAFTYQGELANGGTPAVGLYDIRFRLYDAASGGNQIGSTLCSDNLAVTAGRFAASLDFGAVFTGQKRYLEIEVRADTGLDCSDATGYSVLTPRQELTAAPQAAFALTASNASNAVSLNGQSSSFYQNAANLTGTLTSARLSGTYAGPLSFTNPANIFTGNGATITNLSASNISNGVLDSARMPTNWAAGGDLNGFYPSPTIAPGAVSLSKLTPSVRGVLSSLSSLTPAPAPVGVDGWGYNGFGQLNVPALPAGLTYTAVAAGSTFSLALRSDGNVVGWGANNDGQLNVPALPPGVSYVAVAAGGSSSLALRSDGNLAAWGGNSSVPALPAGVTYKAAAAGGSFSLALRSDGSVAAWGDNRAGQLNVPALASGMSYTALAGGNFFSVALRSDGSVVAWGDNTFGQLYVPALPGGVIYTAVAAGAYHAIALRSDGNVVGWGDGFRGQIDVPGLPMGVTYTAVAAAGNFSVALRSDGTVVGWGENQFGQINAPTPPAGAIYTALAAGQYHGVALRAQLVPASLGTAVGLSVGSSTPPPATGGLSVAGASSFADAVSAASFSGSGANLVALNASNITSGTLDPARVPTLDASKIATGTFAATRIPDLDALKIATGTLANARTTGTSLNTSSTLVLRDASGNFSAGTITAALNGNATSATSATNATQLNGQPASFYTIASNITTGTLADARLSGNIPRLNTNNSFSGSQQTFAGNVLVGGVDNIALGVDAQTIPRLGLVKKSGFLPMIASAANQPIIFAQSDQPDLFTNIGGSILTERLRIAANGNIQVPGGVITNGTAAIPTTDLGLYSQTATLWMRFVTNNGAFQCFSDSGAGTTPRMTLSPTGNLTVSGSLAKAGGSFKIDHPLDPENKYLYHSFVESPDMMNIYNGEVTTDGTGYAVVTLPDYFQALNRDFRYQLTVIDDEDQSDALVWAKVVRRIGVDAANTFTIRTFRPNVAVSWQVTGIRKDAWAEKNRIPNSVDKPAAEKGSLLHPEAFGKPSFPSSPSSPAARPTPAAADLQPATP